MSRLLLVEDDDSLALAIEFTLKDEGYEVIRASTVEEGKKAFEEYQFDLLILDVNLPDGSGYELCKYVRVRSDVPIMFLTALDDEVNIVLGLEIGGDDYITKPFRVREFLSRVKALLRRNSKIIYNDIMQNKDLSKEQSQKFLKDNELQLNRMKWLIQSMLKLAKLDAKAIDLGKKEQSLNDTIKETIYALESKAKEGKVNINFIEKGEVVFNHDRFWMEEALINIVKNAIEHTREDGLITIELTENPIYRSVTIEDNGEGISEEDLPNIFKRFYKVKTSTKSDSVGIGLSLAKSVVEFHNRIIEAQSKVSEGTKFTITFINY